MRTLTIIFFIICGNTLFSQIQQNQLSKQQILVEKKKLLLISNSDKYENIYLYLYEERNTFLDLVGTIGVSNGNLPLDKSDKIKLNTCSFTRKDLTEYWFEVGDKSSTYGATSIIIIWNNGLNWEFTKTPFSRFELIKNGNGITTIKDLRSKKTRIMSFKDGVITII
jgi:hypothetical protein